MTYRDELAKDSENCSICGVVIKKHLRCELCAIMVGPGHYERWLSEFRGYKLCSDCIGKWKRREEKRGRRITFEELQSPRRRDKSAVQESVK